MAKKKSKKRKLNMWVVMLLVVVFLGLGAGVMLSSQRVRNWLFPEDPVAAADRAKEHVTAAEKFVAQADALKADGKDADAAYADAHKEYDLAALEYAKAFGFSKEAHPRGAEFCHGWGKMLIAQAKADGKLGKAKRRELHEQGIECLRNAMQRDPKHVASQRLICEELWPFASRQPMRRDDPRVPFMRVIMRDHFMDDTDKLLRLDEKDHETWYRRARVRAIYADIAEEEIKVFDDIQKAIDLKPDEAKYWMLRAEFEERSKRVADANKTYRGAIATFSAAHDKLKSTLPTGKPADEALQKEFDDLSTTFANIRVAYAMSLRRQNSREDAVLQVNQAIKDAPKSVLPLLVKAQFLQADQQAADALPVLKAAQALDETNYAVYLNLAKTHRALKDSDQALAVLRKGLEILKEETSKPDPTPEQDVLRKNARYQLNYDLAGSLLATIKPDTDPEKRKTILKEARDCAAIVGEPGSTIKKGIPESMQGRIAYISGDLMAAKQFLERATEEFGTRFDSSTAGLLMQLYLTTGESGKAERIVDRFLGIADYRNNVPILLIKAELQMGQNKWVDADRLVSHVLELDSGNTRAATMRAVIALSTGQTEILPADLELSQPILRLVTRRVDELLSDEAEEKKAKALALIEELYKRVPDDTNVTVKLLQVYESMNLDEKVKELLAKIEKDKPDLAKRIEYAKKFVASTPAERLAMQIEKAKEIEDPFRRALTLADLYRSARQAQLALKYLDEADTVKKDDPSVIIRRFELGVAMKNWTLAETALAAAAKADIDGVGGKLLGARLAAVRGKVDIALKTYSDILKEKKTHMRARLERGELYYTQGELELAEADFRTIWSSHPSSAIAAIRMMLITERQGKTAEFEEWLNDAQRLAPNNQDVLTRTTNRDERLAADPEEIITKREKQLTQNPNDLNNRLRLGMLYERVKEVSKAEAMYRSVHANAQDKLFGTRILAGFYGRNNRLGEADALIQNLLKTTTKKVEAYVMYGEFLTPFKPEQARKAYGQAILEDAKNPVGHFALARFHAATGNMNAAINSMTQCVALRENEPRLVKTLITYQLRNAQFTDAGKLLDGLLKENPTDAQALQLKAQMLLQSGEDLATAEHLLTQAVTNNSKDVNALLVRANFYAQIPDMKKAKLDLEEASRLSADSVGISLRLAAVHVALREYDQAEARLRGVLARRANMPQAIEQLVGLYTMLKKWAPLETLLDEASVAYPQNPRYHVLRYGMFKLRKEQAKAIAALTAAMEVAPDDPITTRIYLGGLLEAEQYAKVIEVAAPKLDDKKLFPWLPATHARALAKSGKVAEAEKLFKDLVSRVAADDLAFVAGQMYEGLGPQKAIANLPQWRGREDEWQLHGVMANLYRLDDKNAEAVKAITKAKNLTRPKSRERAACSLQLGMAYYQLGRKADAEKAYLAAEPFLPKEKNLFNNLAYLYVEDFRQPEKALPFAERAYKLDRRNGNVVDTYAWVLANLKRYDEAEKLLTDSITIGTAVAATRLHLGWVYEKQDKLDEALRQYRNGQEMISDKAKNKKLYDEFAESIKRVAALKKNR